MRIYFGDIVHTWEKASVWTVPINVGFVAAYTKKHFPDAEISIFKDPNELLAAARQTRPDVVALSSYAWNENLTQFLVGRIKELDPSILTVEGGPNFTVLNSSEDHARPYFAKHRGCDAYVLDQGEMPFVELMRRWLDCDGDVARLRNEMIPSVMINDLASNDRVTIGPSIGTLENLDDIPSPYLTGLLDPFLEQSYVPLLETNRSCPYQCTFCALAVSTGAKLKTFGLNRIFEEIEYIASRTKADYLITTDANFGILDRDADIAAHVHETQLKHNFPGHLCIVWNKTRPDRVMRTARAFKGLAPVGASMQSLQPEVLDAIKRKNLPIEVVREMSHELRGNSVSFFSELIACLPEQTFDGHISDNRTLMDLGAEVFNYNLRLLPGTEMNTPVSRAKYVGKSGWRLQADAFGLYDGELVLEGEEIVLGTPTMSEDEVHDLRLIHFLLQYMWGKGLFIHYVQLFRAFDLNPMDVILSVAGSLRKESAIENPGPVGQVFKRFAQDQGLERFETFEALRDYWSQTGTLARLKNGEVRKLNSFYGFELMAVLDDFLAFLLDHAEVLLGDRWAEAEPLFSEILRYVRESFVDLDAISSRTPTKSATFSWNILGWSATDYAPHIPLETQGGSYTVEFYRDDRKFERAKKNISFFAHDNRHAALRTLFDMKPAYFLFGSRAIEQAAAAE